MNELPILIRRFRADDATAVANLYRRAVRIGAAHAYPRKALIAWATPHLSLNRFRARMLPTWTFVAAIEPGRAVAVPRARPTAGTIPVRGAGQGGTRGARGQIVLGFAEVMQDGHVRMLFTDPAATRHRIATRLLAHGLNQARAHGITCFTTDASRVSRPVFARAGFRPVGNRMRAVGSARLLSCRVVMRLDWVVD